MKQYLILFLEENRLPQKNSFAGREDCQNRSWTRNGYVTDKCSSIAWRCCVGTNRFVLWQVRLGTQLHIVLLFSPQTLTLTSLVPSRQLINNTLHPICLRCLVKYSTLCLKVSSFLTMKQWQFLTNRLRGVKGNLIFTNSSISSTTSYRFYRFRMAKGEFLYTIRRNSDYCFNYIKFVWILINLLTKCE